MVLIPVPYIPEGQQKTPICKKCFAKPAVVFCKDCGCPLCQNCRKKHACSKKEKKEPN